MYKFNIKKILANSNTETIEIIPKKINILVGPNNSGKSRFLKELRNYLSGNFQNRRIIVDVAHSRPENAEELDTTYDVSSLMIKDPYGNWLLKSYSNNPEQHFDVAASAESYFTRNINALSEDWHQHLKSVLADDAMEQFFLWYGSLFYQYLGTEERLTICKTQSNWGLDSNNANFLSSFKFQEELLQNLSDKVYQLFKRKVFLDTQTLGNRLAFRVSDDFSYLDSKELSSEQRASKLYSEPILDDQGDGLKSFVSTYLAINFKRDILLLDEPEAFLHPPLARQFGEIIGELHNENKTIFIATHSVEILKGILSKNIDVNVIRITQPHPGINDIKVLSSDILASILSTPLLRVSRVLEGVFCDKVVITEAEADELIYQELISKFSPASGLYFAHGQNKQTLATIAQLYQKIGIDYEIITDFDILRSPDELSIFLKLTPLSEQKRQDIFTYIRKLRDIVNDSVDTTGMSSKEADDAKKKVRDTVYHKNGIRFFEDIHKKNIQRLLKQLHEYHLHILETGELETLLEDLDVEYQAKNRWIVKAIETVSEVNLTDIPSDSTVHRFISSIIKKL